MFPAFTSGWLLGRVDWSGERSYWRQRAQAKPVPAVVVPAIPTGTSTAHVVITPGQQPELDHGGLV